MPPPRVLPPLPLAAAGFSAAALAAVAFTTAWATAPAPPAPAADREDKSDAAAAGPAGRPPDMDALVETDVPDLDELSVPRDSAEVELDRLVEEVLFQTGEVRERSPLPDGTDAAALLADTPARSAFFGESVRHGGFKVAVLEIWEEDGRTWAFLNIQRKMRRHGSQSFPFTTLMEWWRIEPDGSATFLKAKPAHEITAADLPPRPADDGDH